MKKKLTLSIDPELNRRIDIEAAVRGKGHDRSSIVDALILRNIQLPDDWQHFPDADASASDSTDDKTSPRQRDKTTFYVTVKAARMLGLHSQLTDTNRSRIVEALIEEHVPPWGVYDQRKSYVSSRRTDRRSEADHVNSPALISA